MKISKSKKLEILWQNHNEAYNKARNEAIEEMDNITPIFCVCGKLATGLHTSRCRKFNDKVDSIIINKKVYQVSGKSFDPTEYAFYPVARVFKTREEAESCFVQEADELHSFLALCREYDGTSDEYFVINRNGLPSSFTARIMFNMADPKQRASWLSFIQAVSSSNRAFDHVELTEEMVAWSELIKNSENTITLTYITIKEIEL